MATLKDVVMYLGENYPHKSGLKKKRIIKLCYLVDREYALKYGVSMTGTVWVRAKGNIGPVPDMKTDICWDNQKRLTTIEEYVLSDNERSIIEEVIAEVDRLYPQGLGQFVCNTPPMQNAREGDRLNLAAKSMSKATGCSGTKSSLMLGEIAKVYKAALDISDNLFEQCASNFEKISTRRARRGYKKRMTGCY